MTAGARLVLRWLKFSPSWGRPYWQSFRAVSNTPIMRAVVLIPLFGYWIIFNDALLCNFAALSRWLTGQAPQVPQACSNSPQIKLFAIYFGLCLLGMASALYQVACPREVKRFEDPTDYSANYGSDVVACPREVIPGLGFESGYFQALERRRGYGTEGEVDGGDHRLFA